MSVLRAGATVLRVTSQQIAVFGLTLLALGLAGATIAASFGALPWLGLPLAFGDRVVPEGGIYVQIGVTVLVLALCAYLPANARIMALENSHRRFHMSMKDVARAYAATHRADREGVFRLKGEFDSVRERILFLRDHPELSDLEPGVIEVAAQMSHVSQELARTYSDGRVARARDFLIARQQEVEDFKLRLAEAREKSAELRLWSQAVEREETAARMELDAWRDEIRGLLPELLESEDIAASDIDGTAMPAPDPDAKPERPGAPVDRDAAMPTSYAAE